MTEAPAELHADIFTRERAMKYLGLLDAAPTPAAASAALSRLVAKHRVPRLRWAKQDLFHRSALDAIVLAETGAEVRT